MRKWIVSFFIVFICIISIQTQSQAQYSPVWASYLGGDSTKVTVVRYDTNHHVIYIAGITIAQSGIASPGSHQPNLSGGTNYKNDIFLAKFDTAGQRIWATYIGGDKDEMGVDIALDHTGNVYVSGHTYSDTGIATPGSFMPNKPFTAHFLVKFNANGQRLWGTYYGSLLHNFTAAAHQAKITIDANNNAILAGSTASPDNIASPGAHQEQINVVTPYQNTDGYIAKFSPSGQRLWASYYGGYGFDWILGVNTDEQNNIYITGYTSSGTQIATANAWQSWIDTNNNAAFLAKFNAGGQLQWSTYLGFKNIAAATAIDKTGNIYVYGATASDTLIPSTGTHQTALQGWSDAFLMKFNPIGQRLWGTLYGGTGDDGYMNTSIGSFYMQPYGGNPTSPSVNLALNPEKNAVYICGGTTSQSNIAFGCDYEGRLSKRGFLASFNSNSGNINWSSYHDAALADLAIDDRANIYLVGWTNTDSIASPGSFQENKNSQFAGYFGKVKAQIYCPDDTIYILNNNGILIADTGYVNYNWYRNDTLVQNGTNNQFTISVPWSGIYKVEVITDCQCLYISDTLNVSSGTSIHQNLAAQLQIEISPNPAKHQLLLQGKAAQKQEVDIVILDVLGNIKTKENYTLLGSFTERIAIDKLPSGIYILQMNNGKSSSKWKFVKIE